MNNGADFKFVAQIGDPIVELVELVEPRAIYQLDDGRVGMSRACN
jgi:hypothetical protein